MDVSRNAKGSSGCRPCLYDKAAHKDDEKDKEDGRQARIAAVVPVLPRPRFLLNKE